MGLLLSDSTSDPSERLNRIYYRDKGVIGSDGVNRGDPVIWRYDGANYQLDADNPSGNHVNVGSGVLTVQDAAVTAGVVVKITDGSAGNPSLTFTNDPDTGLLRATTNTGALTAGGSISAEWQLNGSTPQFLWPAGTVSLPGCTVIGDVDNGLYAIGANDIGWSAGGTLTSEWLNTAGAVQFLTAAGTVTAPGLAIIGDPNTGLYGVSADRLGLSCGGVEVVEFATVSGSVTAYLGDNANASMTQGLTINQAGADNEIVCLKSSDVAHGMTTLTETDSYLTVAKVSASAGGGEIFGYSGGTTALYLQANHTTDDTTKSTSGVGHIILQGWTKSGTTSTTPGANSNIVAVKSGSTTRFMLDADGDSHQDVGTAWTNFHGHDDLTLISALAANVTRLDDPIRDDFGAFLFERRAELERLRLVAFNDDGHHFVNMSRLTMLLVGAMQQITTRFMALEARLHALEAP